MKKYEYRQKRQCKCPYCGKPAITDDGSVYLCRHYANHYPIFSMDGQNRIEKTIFVFEK